MSIELRAPHQLPRLTERPVVWSLTVIGLLVGGSVVGSFLWPRHEKG